MVFKMALWQFSFFYSQLTCEEELDFFELDMLIEKYGSSVLNVNINLA